MSRRKMITRDQILNTTYALVRQEGFAKVTARNVAKRMKCSTQPIYLEFKNMGELKSEVYTKMEDELKRWLHGKQANGVSSDPVVSLCLGYVEFAVAEPLLFRSITMDEDGLIEEFKHFVLCEFKKAMTYSSRYDAYIEHPEPLIGQIWVVTTGIASAMTSHFISLDKIELAEMFEWYIKRFVSEKDFPDIFA